MTIVPLKCALRGCDRPRDTKGLCRGHYLKQRDGTLGPCSVPGCGRRADYAGICQTHYTRKRAGDRDWDREIRAFNVRSDCAVPGCGKEARAAGACQSHYYKSRKHNITLERLVELEQESCAICDLPPVKQGKGHVIDHNHACCDAGRTTYCGNCIRGVLCNSCNLGLGHFKDNTERLIRAVSYLSSTIV